MAATENLRPATLDLTARNLWVAIEPVHAVVYFAPEVLEALKGAGLRGFWMGYFAARCAPLGAVPAEVAAAVTFGFAPAMVARAVPDAWAFCPPDQVVALRRRVTAATLERLTGDDATRNEVAHWADLAAAAVTRLDTAGRPLAAANRALAEGDVDDDAAADPWAALWQACTTLREHRGDGHVAALVAEGLSGLDAHVLQVAAGAVPQSSLQPFRGWSEADWDDAVARLVVAGLLDATGALTPAGRDVKTRIEAVTDHLAAVPWSGFEGEAAELTAGAGRLAASLLRRQVVPYPNPMGVPRPVSPGTAAVS